MATHSSFLAWEIPWTEEHGGSKLKIRLDSLEATQWAPRDTCRGSRREWSPLLPLEKRPDSPGEYGMPAGPIRGPH